MTNIDNIKLKSVQLKATSGALEALFLHLLSTFTSSYE